MTTGAPLIIDCDPGIDDVLAIFLALASPEFDLRAVTTVAGNRDIDKVTQNALALLTVAGRTDIPVHRGCHRGLLPRNIRYAHSHGENGLGSFLHPGGMPSAAPGHAVDVLVDEVMAADPQTVTLVAIGPLTNVAMAFAKEPALPARLKRLLIMGGAVGVPGNITPMAEFNFMRDPSAAHIVLSSGAAMDLFGLNVTRQVVVNRDFLTKVAAHDSACCRAMTTMLQSYAHKDGAIHDPCVVAYLLAPELFGGTLARISVDYRPGLTDGASLIDRNDPDESLQLNLIETVDSEGVLSLIADRLENLP